jgi:hypothetical protein
MAIKVREITIQAKVNEGPQEMEEVGPVKRSLSSSDKKEIVDQVMKKVKDYMKRQKRS